jgi:YD repeat-containing protein
MTAHRRDGPTPARGAYSEAFYSDDAGNEVDAERATRVVITEYDADGRRLAETWGSVDPDKKKKKPPS